LTAEKRKRNSLNSTTSIHKTLRSNYPFLIASPSISVDSDYREGMGIAQLIYQTQQYETYTINSNAVERRPMHCTPFSNPSTTIKPLCSCVEPVLGSILDAEIALHALTRLRCHTTRSVDTVDLLVVAIKAHKLEPGHATEVVGAFAGG
jgi:hypothetical protein